jgi:hypothetical protein
MALERVERFPSLGRPTDDPDIRQIVVPFGAAGYIVRYQFMDQKRNDIRSKSAIPRPSVACFRSSPLFVE